MLVVASPKKAPERTTLWRRGYDVAPPSGESIKMVEERVWPFLDALRREKIKVALSVHGNSMRVIRRYFEHMSVKDVLTHENPLGTDYALYVIRQAAHGNRAGTQASYYPPSHP